MYLTSPLTCGTLDDSLNAFHDVHDRGDGFRLAACSSSAPCVPFPATSANTKTQYRCHLSHTTDLRYKVQSILQYTVSKGEHNGSNNATANATLVTHQSAHHDTIFSSQIIKNTFIESLTSAYTNNRQPRYHATRILSK